MSLVKLAANLKQLIRPIQRHGLDVATGSVVGSLVGAGIGYNTKDKDKNTHSIKRALIGAAIGGIAGGSWAGKVAINRDKLKKVYKTNDREFYNSNRRFAAKYEKEENEYYQKQRQQPQKPFSESTTKASKLKPLIARDADWDTREKYENYLHKKYGGDPYRDITGRRTVKLQPHEFHAKKIAAMPEFAIPNAKYKLKSKLYDPKGTKYEEGDLLYGRHMHKSQQYIPIDDVPLTPSGIKQFKRKLSKDARKESKGYTKLIQNMQYMENGKYRSKKGKIIPFAPAPYPKPIIKPESKYFNLESTNVSDIKKQFREKMKLNHPDVGGNPEIFREIHDEYENVTTSPWFKHISKKKRPKKKMGLVSLSKGK